ncbi:RluA family pseudouridine synthase [Comamonas jiangduensis]|uniref:Pseudouridine synthase n=1 Tax=Comamonas jiangduensis TaxID=1194168 RepID=A0ABV4IF12_9BURK|nr:RluA family pseudouridine synthase [Comamonas aquatica]
MCVSSNALPLDQDVLLESEDAAEVEAGASAVEVRELKAGMAQHGTRLDKTLVDLVPEFSRSYLQQLLEQGAVQLNHKTATKASAKVKLADVISIEMRPTAQSQSFKPEVMALDVVYEDAYLLVVNKPAGLVVHPAPGNWQGTLLNGLLAHHAGAAMVPRAGIVHRLDKDTSGLMVVAKDRSTMDALVALIARRDVSRRYLALAHKPWKGAELQKVDAPIGRDPRNRLRMAVVDLAQHAGKEARTDITCWDTTSAHCLVHCKLHTGRTHQIRVHMLSLGHPLVADALYGGAPAGDMQRQALHAFRLSFVHPVTAEVLELAAEPPEDFLCAIEKLGLRYNPH